MTLDLDFQAGASPLASRQNPVIYAVIGIAFVIIIVFVAIWVITTIKKRLESTPEWQEAQKSRPTKHQDVKQLEEKYLLSPQESSLLWFLCHKYQIPNILYSIREFDKLDEIFKQAYKDMLLDNDDDRINRLFALKFKLDKIFASTSVISSTLLIPKGINIALLLQDSTKIKCSIYDNSKDYISVLIPDEFYASPNRPKELDKVAFTFAGENGMSYAFITRIMRYEEIIEGVLMFVAHTPNLMTKTQRNYKRKFLNEHCTISSVSIITNKQGKKSYKISDNKYNCSLTNISGGGCCVSTKLPIKEGQIVCTGLDFQMDGEPLIGKIIKTRKANIDGIYNLHIQFIKISKELQNKILAKVYGYD